MNRNRFVITLACCWLSHAAAQMPSNAIYLEELPSKQSNTKVQEDHTPRKPATSNTKSVSPKPTTSASSSTRILSEGNLPSYALRAVEPEQIRVPTMAPENSDGDSLVSLKRGQVLRAVISQNIAVYPGSNAPVTARVISGPLKGSFIIGTASLDKTTKRANISFTGIRTPQDQETYSFNGELTSVDGIMGLEGNYETTYWTYLLAEAATNMVAGFARSATPYAQTPFGTYAQEPGLKTQTTTAIAEGVASTAERIGDRTKNAPEITTVAGPLVVDVIVTK